jgi:hypothetical protein
MSRRLSICLLLLAAAGCTLPDGPRERPSPTFDARKPFPELTDSEKSADESDEGESYEERIARASGDSTDDQAQAVSRQLVPLAGQFVAEMPSNFDEWQWSGDGRTTLISYRESGATNPSALVYVESFSSLMRTSPSFEMNRFHRTVDPNLAQDLIPPALTSMAADFAAKKTGMPVQTLVNTVMRSISHTMGAGLNYRSADETFTGWRWVGESERDISFRLARTDGQWATRAQYDPSIQGTLDQAAARSKKFDGAAQAYRRMSEQLDRDSEIRARAAWMIVGSASTTADSGIHIAMVCESQPACPVAQQLSDMLASLRVADASTLGRVGEPTTDAPAEKAKELGLPYLPSRELLSPGELESLLEQLSGQQ